VRLFVTGGLGYVGSVTTEVLLERGHEVTVFDDVSTGHRAALPAGARLVVGDVRDPVAVTAALPPGCDAVLHFAAKSIVPDSLRDPLGYYEHNVGGALTLLRAVTARSIPRFRLLFERRGLRRPRTAADSRIPTPRSGATPTAARSASSSCCSKRRGGRSGCDRSRCAISTPAGASDAHGRGARSGNAPHPARLAGGARRRTRCRSTATTGRRRTAPASATTCTSLDLADAHARALEALDSGVTGAINLGSGQGHSVREILACAERVTGRPVAARVEPRRPGDPPRLVADVQRAAARARLACAHRSGRGGRERVAVARQPSTRLRGWDGKPWSGRRPRLRAPLSSRRSCSGWAASANRPSWSGVPPSTLERSRRRLVSGAGHR
jgi:UDP-glucose 4-epimerase